MNGHQAKALRRDLRRAVGAEARQVIDTHSAVIEHRILPILDTERVHVQSVDDRVKALESRDYELEARLHDLHERLQRLEAWHDAHQTFWSRLMWLARGV